MDQLRSVGLVGLGFMGHGMAANLLKHGFALNVLAHRRREAVDDLVAKGAREVATAAELAAQSDIVLLCVTGAEQVKDLVERPDGLLAGAKPGLIVVDCTTSSPDTLISLQAECPQLTFVDSPLGRSPAEGWEGRLSVLIGADDETFSCIGPVIRSFASTVQHVGPLGSGHALKLVNNFVSMGYAAIYSEALVLALKAGLAAETFDELIRSSRMDCKFFETFMGWVTRGDSDSHPFSLSNADHTVNDVARFSASLGLEGGLIRSIAAVYDSAVRKGMGGANLPVLPRSVALDAGIDLMPLSP